MPNRQRHRGRNPEDARMFLGDGLKALFSAAWDYALLLDRGYPPEATMKLVGDRWRLAARQRSCVSRAVCSRSDAALRLSKKIPFEKLKGKRLAVDGFNLLVTVEAALSGGITLRCADGSMRDMASVHGAYKKVSETPRAVMLIMEALAEAAPSEVEFIFDAPVSNSGRVRRLFEDAADGILTRASARLENNPDKAIVESGLTAVSSDSAVLDGCAEWADLAGHIIKTKIPDASALDFSNPWE